MGTSNTIDAQFREWERRIARTASHAERQKQRQHQPAMHPAMISPYANDWMPFTDFQGVTPSTSRPSQDFIDLTSLEPRSDLPSLLELESLHGLDGREGCRETFPSDWLSPVSTSLLCRFLVLKIITHIAGICIVILPLTFLISGLNSFYHR